MVIRLIEKKDKDKRFIQNWGAIIFAKYRCENSFKSNGFTSTKDFLFLFLQTNLPMLAGNLLAKVEDLFLTYWK